MLKSDTAFFIGSWLFFIFVMLVLTHTPRAQEIVAPHVHGVTVPDWYDPDCCDLQDCRPVPDEDIEFGINPLGEPIVIHKPSGLEFTKDRWRPSQDERYHACFRPNYAYGFCVYLPGGA